MIKLRQAIVVEGRYDKNALCQLVDAPVIETHGFGVMKDRRLLGFLRQVAAARGLIILTDSDGAGFVIRNFLKGALPPEQVLHAYIPDVPGKERRKRAPGKEGKLGVEGMPPEVLLEALRRAGAQAEDSPGAAGSHHKNGPVSRRGFPAARTARRAAARCSRSLACGASRAARGCCRR